MLIPNQISMRDLMNHLYIWRDLVINGRYPKSFRSYYKDILVDLISKGDVSYIIYPHKGAFIGKPDHYVQIKRILDGFSYEGLLCRGEVSIFDFHNIRYSHFGKAIFKNAGAEDYDYREKVPLPHKGV